MKPVLIILSLLLLYNAPVAGQCFATSGNPVGGTANMGILDRGTLLVSTFYRFSYADRYLEGHQAYDGSMGILKDANFNYCGALASYGLFDKLTVEMEGGYFINKTQRYKFLDHELTGFGPSNLVLSAKPLIYFNPETRFEISGGLGASIPFSLTMQQVNGVTLPVDIQPSTGSFGLVAQLYLIKENSFVATRYFMAARVEKFFKNNQDFLFGNIYSLSGFFSKHFAREDKKLKHTTAILQLRGQIKDRNVRVGNIVEASGNFLVFLSPQVNFNFFEHWNLSIFTDIPVYQYYNEIQLASRGSVGININRIIGLH
jgi:hypothetical protein